MSDHQSDFRPLAFPQLADIDGDSVSGPPPVSAEPAAPPRPTTAPGSESADPQHAGFVVADRCEPEDEFCEEHHAPPPPSEQQVPIAGRIDAETLHPAAGELVEMVLRLGQRLRGHLDARFGAFGLSDARFAALAVIREAAPAGCTQAHLAAKLGQCESSISTLVERMRASHLLYRLRAKADRRKRVLMLTDEGRLLLEQGMACRDREADVLFSGMADERQQQLSQTLGRIMATLDRISDEAPREVERPAA